MSDLIVQLFEEYPVLYTVLAGLLAAHLLAVFITNLTPTPRDDRIVGKVYKVVEWVAGVLDNAKALPGGNRKQVKVMKRVTRSIAQHRDTFNKKEEEDE